MYTYLYLFRNKCIPILNENNLCMNIKIAIQNKKYFKLNTFKKIYNSVFLNIIFTINNHENIQLIQTNIKPSEQHFLIHLLRHLNL